MNSKVIRVMRPSIPTGYMLHIVIQQGQSQVINRLKHSFATSPLFFRYGMQDETWKVTKIRTILDPNHPGESSTEITIDKLLESRNESPNIDVVKDVSIVSLDDKLSEISFPKFDVDNKEFYDEFVKRLIDLWPEVKRQCADYLDIPTFLEAEEVFSINVNKNPNEIISFCFENFSRLFTDYSYDLFDGKAKIKSTFSYEYFPEDHKNMFWEFLVIAHDFVEYDSNPHVDVASRKKSVSEEKGNSSVMYISPESIQALISSRGFENVAAEVVIQRIGENDSRLMLIKNMSLPLSAFQTESQEEYFKLPYPYEEQLDLFVNTVKTLLLDETSSETKKRERLQDSEFIIARAYAFKKIKDANLRWTLGKVADEYNQTMYERIRNGEYVEFDKRANSSTVRNAYRKMDWEWERGDRTR